MAMATDAIHSPVMLSCVVLLLFLAKLELLLAELGKFWLADEHSLREFAPDPGTMSREWPAAPLGA